MAIDKVESGRAATQASSDQAATRKVEDRKVADQKSEAAQPKNTNKGGGVDVSA